MIRPASPSAFVYKWILFFTAFVFYYNAIPNEFALDDVMVLTENRFVQRGISGIPDIVSHDSFYGATLKAPKQLGWRYRPLSLISFAIEYPFFHRTWQGYHFMNIVYYALLGLVMFGFLVKWISPGRPGLAFAISLLFLVSPVHPEVVANIKSRDEIFALLFLILYFNNLMKFGLEQKAKNLISALFFLLLALASKESNALAFFYTPVLLYVLRPIDIPTALRRSLPFMGLVLVYIGGRLMVSPIPVAQNDLMNDPYALASVCEKAATILFILLKYIQLMIVPDQLSFDYGYNHIPYHIIRDPRVIASSLLHLILFVWAIVGTWRRNIAAACMLFYLPGIFLLSNAVILVGPPMAERFLFTPGFFFIVSLVLTKDIWIRRLNPKVLLSMGQVFIMAYVLFAFSVVHARNPEWKNNRSLYFSDVRKVPNSVRVQAFCAMSLLGDADKSSDSLQRVRILREAIDYFEKAYSIYQGFAPMYQDWGACYQRLGNVDSTAWAWARNKELRPDSRYNTANEEMLARMKYNACVEEYQRAKSRMNIPELLDIQRRGVSYNPQYAPGWLFLGKLYSVNGQNDSAAYCWKKCLELNPSESEAKSLLEQFPN